MRAIVRRLKKSRVAQDLAEYGIALAVIGTAASAVGLIISGNITNLWDAANSIIATAAS